MIAAARAHAGTALALSIALVAAVAPARASASTPAALYPVQTEKLTRDEAADVQAILESALRLANRRDVISARQPAILRSTCGIPPADACLASMARGGVVLHARAMRRGEVVIVTIAFVDGEGRRTRSVSFGLDLTIQNVRPADQAISTLEYELRDLANAPPPADMVKADPLPPPARASAAATKITAQGRSSSRATAGKWLTGGGVAVVAGGIAFGVLARQANASLTDKYASGSLGPADASSYSKVKRYNTIANSLLVVGGVMTATGFYYWMVAPDVQPVRGGVTLGLAGQF